jgi:hypothetical protein
LCATVCSGEGCAAVLFAADFELNMTKPHFAVG